MKIENIITSNETKSRLIINDNLVYQQTYKRNTDVNIIGSWFGTIGFADMIKADVDAEDFEIIEDILERLETEFDASDIADCLEELEEYEYIFDGIE